LVSECQNYFKLFFEFNKHFPQLAPSELPKSIYEFQLEGAFFVDGPTEGFSLTLWITTVTLPTKEEAMFEWSNALSRFVDFAVSLAAPPGLTPIYAQGKPLADFE
jgi:hypothetical protein